MLLRNSSVRIAGSRIRERSMNARITSLSGRARQSSEPEGQSNGSGSRSDKHAIQVNNHRIQSDGAGIRSNEHARW